MPRFPADAHDTIIKVGGSLLDLPDVGHRLSTLIDENNLQQAQLLVGGGEAASLVRNWDQRFGLSDESAHQLAIRAMSLNADLVVCQHSRFRLVESLADLRQTAGEERGVGVINVVPILRELESQQQPLPRTWSLTSDTIAAWIADCCGFANLLILKSVDLAPEIVATLANTTAVVQRLEILRRMAATKTVDAEFPPHAITLGHLSWCNLRSESPEIQRLW